MRGIIDEPRAKKLRVNFVSRLDGKRESVPSRHEAVSEEKSEVAAGKALEFPEVQLVSDNL